jgi:tetratricopeptide (TPR) repeat protein
VPASPWVIDNQDTYSADSGANRAYALGTHELLNGDPKAAVQYLNIALLKVPDFSWAKAKLADAYYRINEIDKARKLIDGLINVPGLSVDIRYAALHVQSNLQYATGKLDESRQTSEALLILANELNNPLAEAAESMNIGTSYQANGKIPEAQTYLDRALSLYDEAAYKPGVGMALFNIGNLYMSVNNTERAADYYSRAEMIFNELGNLQFAAITRYQQANLLVREGQLEKARTAYQSLMPIYERLGDIEGVALTKIDLAYVNMSLEGDEQGIKVLLKYLPELEQDGLQYARLQAQKRLVVAYLNLHQPRMARKYMPVKSEFVTTDPSETLLPAHLAYEEGRFEEAVSLAEEVKKHAGTAWLPQHQQLLDAYRNAKDTGEKTDIRI